MLSLGVLSGCTVIGAAADIGLADVTTNKGGHNRSTNTKDSGFEFAQVGAEIDAAIIAGLVEDYKSKKEGVEAVGEESETGIHKQPIPTQSTFVGLCARKLKKDESCYSKDYYNQFRAQLAENQSVF